MPLDKPGDEPVRSQPRYPPHEIDAIVAYVGLLGGPPIPDVSPKRGDIAVFRTQTDAASICPGPGAAFVKRLIGLPGDEVELRDRLYVNGMPLDEPYLNGAAAGPQFGPVTVPEGEYFLMGDNRYQSCDSREFGTVPRESITSRVVAIYWPLDRLGIP